MRRGSGDRLFPNEIEILSLISEMGEGSTADLMRTVADAPAGSKPMNAATVFRIVNRLTQRGFLSHSWSLPAADAPQRAHRLFKVTAKGAERVVSEAGRRAEAAAAAQAAAQ